MKKHLIFVFVFALFLGCDAQKKNENKEAEKTTDEMAYVSIGKEIIADDALAADRMATHYESMKVGDTVDSKMIAKVDEVCQAKGCWMKLNLKNGEQVMVKFKDYGFFMPKDIAGKEVVINGKAFVEEMSVEDQKHFAKDAGQSEAEIATITTVKKTYAFEADGVLLKQ